ncbi:hypothetical protein [Acutalibacter muris]|uniref:hypothetical protein n=1 Tax=Acutalibacter muris TaxID=1796620 RepID=UPI001C3F01FE|nr:hypothetical protein [Acutalibacter muris]
MNRVKKLKRDLGSEYAYQRFMSDWEVSRLRRQMSLRFEDTIAASLTVGCMKINTVLFQTDDALRLGYDVYVKDAPGSAEWICFDCPSDRASLKEQEMLAVLDRIVTENGLSYTECCFEQLEGIFPPDKKIG